MYEKISNDEINEFRTFLFQQFKPDSDFLEEEEKVEESFDSKE